MSKILWMLKCPDLVVKYSTLELLRIVFDKSSQDMLSEQVRKGDTLSRVNTLLYDIDLGAKAASVFTTMIRNCSLEIRIDVATDYGKALIKALSCSLENFLNDISALGKINLLLACEQLLELDIEAPRKFYG